jgi:hypothetical protein
MCGFRTQCPMPAVDHSRGCQTISPSVELSQISQNANFDQTLLNLVETHLNLVETHR